jgi:hypothetical protein
MFVDKGLSCFFLLWNYYFPSQPYPTPDFIASAFPFSCYNTPNINAADRFCHAHSLDFVVCNHDVRALIFACFLWGGNLTLLTTPSQNINFRAGYVYPCKTGMDLVQCRASLSLQDMVFIICMPYTINMALQSK